MATKKVSEALARPVRTGLQGTPAWIITEGIDAWFYDMNDRQYGITVLFLTMAFGYVQAIVENYLGKGLLRNMTPTGTPVVSGGE